MEKKQIIWFFIFIAIFLWLFFIGQGGHSAIFGDINLIDEGQYAAWVSQMLHGKMIYRDIYVQYGPLMVFPIYLLMKFFGQTIFFVYLWATINTYLGYIVGLLALKKLRVNKLLFVISSISLLIVPGINIRQWIGVLIFILLMKSSEKKSSIYSFLTGSILVIAILQSIEIGLFTLLICVLFIIARFIKSRNLQEEFNLIAPILLGVIFASIIFFSISQNQGWFQSYISTTKEFSASISGANLPNGKGLPSIFSDFDFFSSPLSLIKFLFSKNMLFYWSLLLLFIFFSFSLIRISLKSNSKNTLALLISIFAIMIYFSIVGRSGHYISIFPFIVIIGAYCISDVKKDLLNKSLKLKNLNFIFLLIFCLFVLRHIAIYRFALFPNFEKEKSTVISKTYPLHISSSQAHELLQLQEFFKNNSYVDSIYVLNNAPGLYFILNLKNVTRYDLPLLAGTIEKRYEIVNDLIKSKPIFILEDKNSWAVDEVSDEKRMPEIFQYARKNYHIYKEIGHYIVYKINETR